MTKCPYCNGNFDLKVVPHPGVPRGTPPGTESILPKLEKWLQTPVALDDLLVEYGCPNLARFEPLGRMVVRTAFRSKDALAALGLDMTSSQFRGVARALPGWYPETEKANIFGVQGRWWVKEGFTGLSGFEDAYAVEDYDEEPEDNIMEEMEDLI